MAGKINVSKYNKCIEHCELESVDINKVNIEVFKRIAPGKNSQIEIDFETSAEQQDNTIHAFLTGMIEGKHKPSDKKPAWAIEIKLQAAYQIPEHIQLSQEELSVFSSRQAVLTLVPYMRANVCSYAAQCGLGAITLPLIHPKSFEHEAKQAEAALNSD